jgi:hypothetical protein
MNMYVSSSIYIYFFVHYFSKTLWYAPLVKSNFKLLYITCMALHLSNFRDDEPTPDLLCGCTIALHRDDCINEWLSIVVLRATPGAIVVVPFPHYVSAASTGAHHPPAPSYSPHFVRPPEAAPDALFATLATLTPSSHVAEIDVTVTAAQNATHMRHEGEDMAVIPTYADLLHAQKNHPWREMRTVRLMALREAYGAHYGFVLLRIPKRNTYKPVLASWTWFSNHMPSSTALPAIASARCWWFINEPGVVHNDGAGDGRGADLALAPSPACAMAIIDALRHYSRWKTLGRQGWMMGDGGWHELPDKVTCIAVRFAAGGVVTLGYSAVPWSYVRQFFTFVQSLKWSL